jgi:hypothetical protein
MTKRIKLICVFLTTIGIGELIAQPQNEYKHCNCTENVSYLPGSKEKLDGEYQMTCNGNQILTGQYVNGLKSGKWVTKTAKGTIIKSAEYSEGKLNGRYELFHFDGTPKLVASFTSGQQDGVWQYFNEKRKIIKTGKYQMGSPIGTWTIFDKGGKKVIATYDCDNTNSSNSDASPYFKNGGIQRDDQSGEWYIIYYPERNPQSQIEPFGGYSLACDFFLKHLTIPTTMMDTYTNFNFVVTLQVENNAIKNISTVYADRFSYSPELPTFPFIVSTNPPGKLKRVDHSKHSINLLKEYIEETAILMGPWIGSSTDDIYVPFVLNDIKKF